MITVLVVVECKRKINITAVIVSVLILENVPFSERKLFSSINRFVLYKTFEFIQSNILNKVFSNNSSNHFYSLTWTIVLFDSLTL